VDFRFKEEAKEIITEKGRVLGVRTERDAFTANVVVDAAGAYSRELCATAGVDIPVTPDSHEGAITDRGPRTTTSTRTGTARSSSA
jgi:sarcosine oxidase subunit beta